MLNNEGPEPGPAQGLGPGGFADVRFTQQEIGLMTTRLWVRGLGVVILDPRSLAGGR